MTGEVEVGNEFPRVYIEPGGEVSRVRYSEPSKVYYNSDVYVFYVLTSSELSKVILKCPIYLFGDTGPSSDDVPTSWRIIDEDPVTTPLYTQPRECTSRVI